MTKNWRILREGVQHRSPSTMISENQVGEILSRRQRNESISQIARTMNLELRSSLRNFESQNEYGYKPCIKRRFQNAETLQSRNQKNSS